MIRRPKTLYKADKKYKERDFIGALELLEEAGRRDNSFAEAHLRMGSLYNALGEVDSVYSKFSEYIRVANEPIASVAEKMAHMSFDRGNYQNSKKYIKYFLSKVPEKRNDREVDLLIRSQEYVDNQLSDTSVSISISELPDAINRYKLQYLPTMTVDGATLIYTKRDRLESDEDIVVSHKLDDVWQESKSISEKINSSLNEGACTISADGRTMIFTSCDRRNAYGSCDLFISKKIGEDWTRPKNLGRNVNSRYWESQPSLSADGRTLFFASNRPGGYGGRDLWVTKSINGVWQEPTNLGSQINSFKDETTPFIHFNGEVLFFSSNSYPGMGGYDLFTAAKLDSSWTKPENLGYPINSFKDEVAFLVNANGDRGFFAKEVQKGSEILESKIVGFEIPAKIRPQRSSYIVGKVIDSKTLNPLKANIEVIDINSNNKIYSNASDSITGEYYMVLPSERKLAGYVKKKGYLYSDFSFTTDSTLIISSDTLLVKLDPIQEGGSMVLKNIYFDVDSYVLDERSFSEIKNVIQILRENPKIHIQISGHTDNTGTKNYNQSLSEKRAKSVYQAILNQGIDVSRVRYVGYGDTKPLISNESEKGRKSNRRIEFSVIRL